MYNPELEDLIDAALTDGVLTEKEKQILFKKARLMGVDLDEFEMVLDARLVKKKKDEEEKAASSAPKSNKMGVVKKCPACGAMVQSYQGVCPECGYAFENVAINSSVDKLSKSLEKCLIDDEYEDYDKMASKIRSFPVPTSKADIMELIMLIQTHLSALKGKSAFDGVGDYRNACIAKLQECSLKAKIIFPNDPMIQKLVDETEKANSKAERNRSTRNTIITIIGIIMTAAGAYAAYYLDSIIWDFDWKEIWRIILIIYATSITISPGICFTVFLRK